MRCDLQLYNFTLAAVLPVDYKELKVEARQEAIRAIHILRDVLKVWTAMEVEDRFGLEGESREQDHSLADGEEKDE